MAEMFSPTPEPEHDPSQPKIISDATKLTRTIATILMSCWVWWWWNGGTPSGDAYGRTAYMLDACVTRSCDERVPYAMRQHAKDLDRQRRSPIVAAETARGIAHQFGSPGVQGWAMRARAVARRRGQ